MHPIEIDSWSWGIGSCTVIAETGNITEDTANGAAFTQEQGALPATFLANDPTSATVALMGDTSAGDFNDFTNYVLIQGANVNTVAFENGDPRATFDTLAAPSTTGLNSIDGVSLPAGVVNLTLQFDHAPIVFDANAATRGLSLTTLDVTAEGIRSPNGANSLTMNVANPANQATFNAGAYPIDLTGNGTFNNLTLTNSGPNVVVINNAGSAPLNFTGASQLGSGPVTITANGTGTAGGISEGSTASIAQASIGAVNGDGIPDLVALASANGPIDLNSATNAFTGAISVAGPNATTADTQNVTLTNSSNLILGDCFTGITSFVGSSQGGTVFQAPGTALQFGGGTDQFTAGTNAGDNVTLGNPNNSFGGTLSVAAFPDGSCVVTGLFGIQFGNVDTNDLTVQAGGPITQATGTAIDVTNEASFTAGSNNITLNSPGNSFAIADMNNDGTANVIDCNGNLTLNQITLGETSLTVNATGDVSEASGGAITQTPVAPGAATLPIVLNVGSGLPSSSIVLGSAGNNIQGGVTVDSHTQRFVPTDITLVNAGNLNVDTVTGNTITGNVNLSAGGIVTLPAILTGLASLEVSANSTLVSSDITVTGTNSLGDAVSFIGAVSLAGGITIDASAANANVTFDGNVTATGTGDISFAMSNGAQVVLVGGTWTEGSNNLDLTAGGGSTGTTFGQGVGFDIGSASATAPASPPAVFAMTAGNVNGDGVLDVVTVEADATLQIGSSGGGQGQVVTLNLGTGGLVFAAGSTYAFGQGTTNAELIDAGSGIIDLSGNPDLVGDGLAGTTATPILATTTAGGAIHGNFLQQTLYGPQDAIDDGSDIVTTALTADATGEQLVCRKAGESPAGTLVDSGIVTVSTTGSFSGYTPAGDLVTITTNASAGATLVVLQNPGGFGLVITKEQDASSPLFLAISTTAGNGSGISQINGIADWGLGSLSIDAPDSDFGAAGVPQGLTEQGRLYDSIEVAGTLTTLVANNIGTAVPAGSQGVPSPFTITDGGTGPTTITANAIDEGLWYLHGVMRSLSATSVDTTSTFSAASFGTITTTGNAATGDPGNFGAVLYVRKSGGGITSVNVAGDLTGTWYVAGNIGSVTAGSTGAGAGKVKFDEFTITKEVDGTAPVNINSLSLGVADAFAINTGGGTMGSLTATSIDPSSDPGVCSIQAASISKITTTGNAALGDPGDCDDLNLQLSGSLGTLNVAGNLNNTNIFGLAPPLVEVVLAVSIGFITVGGEISGGSITNATSIGSVTADGIDNWTVQAATLNIMKSTDSASPNLFAGIVDTNVTLSGSGSSSATAVTLGAVSATGAIQGSTILVHRGEISSINADGLADDTISSDSSIAGITCIDDWQATTVIAASIGSISVQGSANLDDSDIIAFGLAANGTTAPPPTAITVAGNMDDDTLVMPNGISTLSVGQVIGDTEVLNEKVTLHHEGLYEASIGSLTAGGLDDATVAVNTLGTVNITGAGGVTGSTIVANGEGTTTSITAFTVAGGVDATTSVTALGGIAQFTAKGPYRDIVDDPDWNWGVAAAANPNAGTLGTFTAGEIDGATIEASFIGSLSVTGNTSAGLGGDLDNATIDAIGASATAPAIGTLSVAGNAENDTLFSWGATKTFTVGGLLGLPPSPPELLKAKEKANQVKCGNNLGVAPPTNNTMTGIGTMTVGEMANVTMSTQSVHTGNMVGNHKDCMIAVTLDILGSSGGVGLGTFTAAGAILGSVIEVPAGNVTSFAAGSFIFSALIVGAQLPNANDPNGSPPIFGTTPFAIGTFQTTNAFNPNNVVDSASFQDSIVAAAKLGTITLSGVNPAATPGSGVVSFGLFQDGTGQHGIVTVDGSKTPLKPSPKPQTIGNPPTSGEFYYEG